MNINITLIIALAVILALAGLGYKRGLIMSIWHLVSFIVVIAVTIIVSPYVAKFAKNNEKIYNTFYNTICKTVNVPVKSGEDCDKFIEGLKLPEKVEDKVLEKAKEYYPNVQTAQESLADKIHEKLTDFSITVTSFLLTFLVVFLLANMLVSGLDLLSKAPIINMGNKLGGIALGAAEGILIVWAVCGLVPMISATPLGIKIVEQIGRSKLLTFFYEHNLISTVMSGKIWELLKIK